ncbi:hypothetical protein GH714_010503 [Hevea brasiliensis]|uniref:Dof-type domain-containing protein n=1 Tax=Hevea brasiliensis TaxID=3981 RepID=A0A6A6N3N6_HEVBR|nr:hypothetical protein GH714_010503 [Hevea brasiliensis]
MVFTSIPVYLDPPNRQQQPNQQQGAGGENPQLPPPPPPPGTGGGSSGAIRPGSMAERARLAKIPQPEAALKCPRCESTNTKFCYFNNYSLTQPRHFSSGAATAAGGGAGMEFQIGSTSSSGTGGSLLSSALVDQWRLQQVQQFPFLANFEPPTGLYPYEGEGFQPPNYVGQLRSRPLDSGVTQLASVKMEENQGLNLSKNFLGMSGNEQYWGGNAWTDLPGFTSSSTSHLL